MLFFISYFLQIPFIHVSFRRRKNKKIATKKKEKYISQTLEITLANDWKKETKTNEWT